MPHWQTSPALSSSIASSHFHVKCRLLSHQHVSICHLQALAYCLERSTGNNASLDSVNLWHLFRKLGELNDACCRVNDEIFFGCYIVQLPPSDVGFESRRVASISKLAENIPRIRNIFLLSRKLVLWFFAIWFRRIFKKPLISRKLRKSRNKEVFEKIFVW